MKGNNTIEVSPVGEVFIYGVSGSHGTYKQIRSQFPKHVFIREERKDLSDGRMNYALDPGFTEADHQFLALVTERAEMLQKDLRAISENSLEEFYRWCICSSASPSDAKMIAWQEVEKYRASVAGK